MIVLRIEHSVPDFERWLRDLWSRVDVMRDPEARVLEVVERNDL